MVEVAAEGLPHLGDLLVRGVGDREVLAGGERAAQQQRSGGAAAAVGGDGELRDADATQVAIAEPDPLRLGSR